MKLELPVPVWLNWPVLAMCLLWPRAAQSSCWLTRRPLQPALTRSLLDRLTTCVCSVVKEAVAACAGAAIASMPTSAAGTIVRVARRRARVFCTGRPFEEHRLDAWFARYAIPFG